MYHNSHYMLDNQWTFVILEHKWLTSKLSLITSLIIFQISVYVSFLSETLKSFDLERITHTYKGFAFKKTNNITLVIIIFYIWYIYIFAAWILNENINC